MPVGNLIVCLEYKNTGRWKLVCLSNVRMLLWLSVVVMMIAVMSVKLVFPNATMWWWEESWDTSLLLVVIFIDFISVNLFWGSKNTG